MNPDHIGEPNEMIGLRPVTADHFGENTGMVGRAQGRDGAPRRPNSLKKGLPA